MKDILKIYCDGACSGNPGKGGWGAILIWKDRTKELSGSSLYTTNNRMELTAAIQGLLAVKKEVEIEIYSDSQYLCTGITLWIKKWELTGWKNGRKEIKNVDLWKELYVLSKRFSISWYWVKGHSGDKYNEMADKLAKSAIVDSREH